MCFKYQISESEESEESGVINAFCNSIFTIFNCSGGSILDVAYEYVHLGVNFNYNISFIKAMSDIYLKLSVLCLPLLLKVDVYHYR